MATIQIDKRLDARGMPCPGPLMNLIGAIRQGSVGQVIEVLRDQLPEPASLVAQGVTEAQFYSTLSYYTSPSVAGIEGTTFTGRL